MIIHKTHRPIRYQRGAAKVLLVFLAGLILIPLLIIGFYEGRKAYWDAKVREMCAIDGGVKIHQTHEVDLRTYQTLINQFGKVDIPRKGDVRSIESALVHTYEDVYLRRSSPEVRRSRISVIRSSDGSVIATNTTYSRVGGDLVAFHPSYLSCPPTPSDFYGSVVLIKGNGK